jgi:hypothetical protein
MTQGLRIRRWRWASENQGDSDPNRCELDLTCGCFGRFLMRDSHARLKKKIRIHY